MSSWKGRRRLFLSLMLAVVLFSVFAESLGTAYFFDTNIALQNKADPRLRVLLYSKSTDPGRAVNVLVVFSSIPSSDDLAMLEALCTVRTFTGHVATVIAPINLLARIANLPFVTQVAMPRVMKSNLDISVPEILADRVWNTSKYPGVHDSAGNLVTGAGVIIGIADSGIDYSHPDFYFPNGTNKILYIWDQTSTGRTPDGYPYGNECGPSDIQSKTCTEFDNGGYSLTTGHGTAVAAVVASTGQASHRFYGVAPGASIIAVKLIDGSDNYVIDAMSYMIMKARDLNRPLVIVHSLGDSLGSHDGTEPLELAFTDFTEQGIPIVVAAGNDRNAKLHVSGTLSPAGEVNVRLSLSSTQDQVDLWYPVSSLLGLSVTTPSGEVVEGPTPQDGTSTVDGNVIILSNMRPSGREWWINITADSVTAMSNNWSFTLTSLSGQGGRWDAWTEPGQFLASTDPSMPYTIDPYDTIDAPGTAIGIITVGGYITRFHWLARCTICISWNAENNVKGFWWTPTLATQHLTPEQKAACTSAQANCGIQFIGNLTYSSSIGPTRDGRIKPDIVAPSANIAAARASTDPQVCDPYPGICSDPDDYHTVWAGTSFAAPHVAGVIALMLQMNPYLTSNEITSILKGDAREDNFTGKISKTTGSPVWGWGKVDALHSTLDAPSLYSVKIEITPPEKPLITALTIDGASTEEIALNQTLISLVLEFASGHTHTIELTPIITVEPGTRYVLLSPPWTFSSGGTASFTYQEQYYLQVNSEYGYASGTGWYNANTTAAASVSPTNVQGHQFQGWIGSVVSSSPNISITMDSSKSMEATWSQGVNYNVPTLLWASVVIATVAIAVFAIIRLRQDKARRNQTQGASTVNSSRPNYV